jgi:hypothetical protein
MHPEVLGDGLRHDGLAQPAEMGLPAVGGQLAELALEFIGRRGRRPGRRS